MLVMFDITHCALFLYPSQLSICLSFPLTEVGAREVKLARLRLGQSEAYQLNEKKAFFPQSSARAH